MLKLTLADWNSQTEGEPIWINQSHIYYMKPRPEGCYIHLGPAVNGHGFAVKESAEEVEMRMIPGALRASKAWFPPEGTLVPNNPYGVRIVPLGTGLDGTNLNDVKLGD